MLVITTYYVLAATEGRHKIAQYFWENTQYDQKNLAECQYRDVVAAERWALEAELLSRPGFPGCSTSS